MVRIIEVGPRDGLQNERETISLSARLDLIFALAEAGLAEQEFGSFVSPKAVPQMAGTDEVAAGLPTGLTGWALVPNVKGMERALASGCRNAALFTAASEDFVQANIRMSIAESLEVFAEAAGLFRSRVPEGLLRGIVSTAFECPFVGRVDPEAAVAVAHELLELGVDEVVLADTIGTAGPSEVKRLAAAAADISKEKVAWHFHDTRGTAVANVWTCLELGYRSFDSAAGGLGGCPFAPGAGGNLATEDLVYLLEREGFRTGVDLELLARATLPVLDLLGREPESKVQRAVLAGRS